MKAYIRSISILSIIVAFVFGIAMISSAADLVLYNEYHESYSLTVGGNSGGKMSFQISFANNAGQTMDGVAYYDPTWQLVQFIMFETDTLYGYTLAGYWVGDGSRFFAVTGNGATWTETMYTSPPPTIAALGAPPEIRNAK